jgi:hydroxymethylbilane synthase
MLRIGTRKSPLALAQTELVRAQLGACDVVPFSTRGDEWLATPLTELGGKGLFTKELDDAILRGEIDIAVHSMKDMPTVLPDGLTIGAVMKREDVRDVWVGTPLAELPAGAKVGTSSMRRSVQVMAMRPDVEIAPIRGNVGTRISKVESGEFAATVLALAGLKRLGLPVDKYRIIEIDEMLPAVGQGAIAIICRAQDESTKQLLKKIHCEKTAFETRAERAMLKALDGSCRTPIAGYATLHGDEITLRGLVADMDGKNMRKQVLNGSKTAPEALGETLARMLKS